MTTFALILLFACGEPAPQPALVPEGPALVLSAPYADLRLPTAGATVKSQEGADLVLNYDGLAPRDVLSTWVNALNADGWTVEDPMATERFTQVNATRGTGKLEIFVVAQPSRTEVHLELITAD
jgi:hypothetical protein